MRYHKIRGRSVAECMMKLRSSFGPEAIILEHREVNEGGLLGSGLFSRKSYEIEYMLPEKSRAVKGSSDPISSAKAYEGYRAQGTLGKLLKEATSANTAGSSADRNSPLEDSLRTPNQGLGPLFSKGGLQGGTGSNKPGFPVDDFQKAGPKPSQIPAQIHRDDSILRIEEQLSVAQLSPAFTSDFLRHLEDSLSRKEKSEYRTVEQKSLKLLSEMIQTQPSRAPVSGECRALMLIGPTGVGKTTTLAKLAARFHIMEKRAVSLYSLDHYRLAATEQLKTYANVMNIDFFAPLSKEEFAESLRRDGAELILIDSSGVSHSDQERLVELRAYLEVCKQEMNLETHLVLAANMNPSLLGKILKAYQYLDFDKILLTKVDETDFIGAFVEFADSFKRPFSFVTDGQEVPSDIRDADAEEIASMLLALS